MGNIKTIVGIALGGFVGWKVGERFGGTLAEVGGAVVGAGAGYYVAKKL